MRINLKLRAVTGYCSPSKAVIADNEDLVIHVQDKGQLQNRVVLLCNGKSYVADKNKDITIPRAELQAINVLELSERNEEDKMRRTFAVENLFAIECKKEYGESRLLAERAFYREVLTTLLNRTEKTEKALEDANKRLAALENGKFTMFKFGGNNDENN